MRWLIRLLLFCMAAVAILLAAAFGWLYFYKPDLPDTRALTQFAPTTPMAVSDSCSKAGSNAIPYFLIGSNLQNALSAVEVSETDPGVLTELYQQLTGRQPHRAALSLQIARTMLCEPSRALVRTGKEIRTGVQLERDFSPRELFTIYANRTYFGVGLIGVQAASRSFFLKEPNEDNVAEAALIAGLVKSPSRYSPLRHPDRALQRRDEVIDAMLGNGTISASQAETAKATTLGLAPPHVSTMPP